MIISITFPIILFLRFLLTGSTCGVLTGSAEVLLAGLLGFAPGICGRTFILIFGGVGDNWFPLLSLHIVKSFVFIAAVCAGIVYRFGTAHDPVYFQGIFPALWALLHHASNTVNTNAAEMGNIIGKCP